MTKMDVHELLVTINEELQAEAFLRLEKAEDHMRRGSLELSREEAMLSKIFESLLRVSSEVVTKIRPKPPEEDA